MILNLKNFTDTGRFTPSTSEYPEWFLTAFAVAEPEIFALASTGKVTWKIYNTLSQNNKPKSNFINFICFLETSPSETQPTTNPPFYEPRIPASNTDIISSKIDIPNQSSFLTIDNLIDSYEPGKYILFCGYTSYHIIFRQLLYIILSIKTFVCWRKYFN